MEKIIFKGSTATVRTSDGVKEVTFKAKKRTYNRRQEPQKPVPPTVTDDDKKLSEGTQDGQNGAKGQETNYPTAEQIDKMSYKDLKALATKLDVKPDTNSTEGYKEALKAFINK